MHLLPTTRRLVLWVAVLYVPGPTLAVSADDLETLLYTPAQRHDINRSRQGMAGASAATITRLSGVVRRAGGKGTMWINGQPYPEGSPQAGEIKGVDAVVEGRQLRVGQGIDKTTGARTDVVAPGAVTPRGKP